MFEKLLEIFYDRFSVLYCIVSHYHSYVNSATAILRQYKGEEPFASYLKKYFSSHKKYGSKDRKQVSHLCYCFFRLGKAYIELEISERIFAGLLLCSTSSNEVLSAIRPAWNESVALPIERKRLLISSSNEEGMIFPWIEKLSAGIDAIQFNESFLIQPNFFLRIRPGQEKQVAEKLLTAGYMNANGNEEKDDQQKRIRYITDHCIALPGASNLEGVIELDKEAVVQDYNSQKIASFIELVRPGRSDPVTIWDCCAASGGKSILVKDILDDIHLTVSDIRETILSNLKKRFQKAGIHNYKSIIMDLSLRAPDSVLPAPNYDFILCDVPCSGSGTWGRTPEQLYYFREKAIDTYASLQQKIVANVVPYLKTGGYFLYITCSVFKKENDDMVEFIRKKFRLRLLKMEFLKGYDKKADSMFAALFTASAP